MWGCKGKGESCASLRNCSDQLTTFEHLRGLLADSLSGLLYSSRVGKNHSRNKQTQLRNHPRALQSLATAQDMGVSEIRGTLFGGPYNEDPTV